MARVMGARVHEGQALISHARALRVTSGLAARDSIATAVAEAATVIEATGALAWSPFLHEEQARLALLAGDEPTWDRQLAEARRLFAHSGATGHGERLARDHAGWVSRA